MKNSQTQSPKGNNDLWIRGVIRIIFGGVFVAIPIFWAAGTLDWTQGWVFVALLVSTFGITTGSMLLKNPELMRHRWKRQDNTKPFDKVFGLFYLLTLIIMLVLPGLDVVRYGWTQMPSSLVAVGAGLHCLGLVPVLWTMMANPHLETTVRIQEDRGHQVITDGPYRFVRHPMYVGILPIFLGWPLILGSTAALAAWALFVVLFFIRTALEDRMLRNELPGYEDFCQKTRYRLVPGLW